MPRTIETGPPFRARSKVQTEAPGIFASQPLFAATTRRCEARKTPLFPLSPLSKYPGRYPTMAIELANPPPIPLPLNQRTAARIEREARRLEALAKALRANSVDTDREPHIHRALDSLNSAIEALGPSCGFVQVR